MQLGIFAKTYNRPTVEQTLRAVRNDGLSAVQFNMSVLGLPTIPDPVAPQAIAEIALAADATRVTLAAISGTFNAAHPDPDTRAAYLDRFPHLARAAAALEIPVITLSSGSRDREDMWRYHPDNSTEQAWDDSRTCLTRLAAIAEDHGLVVAVEPEHTNVVADATLARRMLDEVFSPALGIVFDAANLLDSDTATTQTMTTTIRDAITVLGPGIALAHAKELTIGRRPVPAGAGILPWQHILDSLTDAGYRGPLIIHGLDEHDVPNAVHTLSGALAGPPHR